MKSKLISNEYRTCSMSNPAVAAEAAGGQECLGYRANSQGILRPIGYEAGGASDDPLEILIREEEEYH